MLEEELARAKELVDIMKNMGQGTNTEMELERRQEEAPVKQIEPVASTTLEREHELCGNNA